MLKFDNTHIFTGYLKQMLSSFNLPTCRVYTKEFANYRNRFGKEDPRVIESFDNIEYYKDTTDNTGKKRISYRVNYLKSNELYNYFWPFKSKDNQKLTREECCWKHSVTAFYDKDKNIPGLTRTLNNPGNVYNSATHEYLGDYLRFLRDYYDVNLMSMYNCFSNNICNNINVSFDRAIGGDVDHGVSKAVFNASDSRYHIYSLPVKLFSDYTIAIDCNQEIEMFCGFYNKTLDQNAELSTKTYKRVNRAFFKQPFLYDRLNVKYWGFDEAMAIDESGYPKFVNGETLTRWDLANREQDLRLFIKVPALCKSSIVILEGDYRGFNDFKYAPITNSSINPTWKYEHNHSIINFGDNLDLNESIFKPISRLQLLTLNTGESYPFADRLVEYLSGSAITPMDEIADNIKRAQKVMSENNHYFKIEGVWENKMQKIIYDYLVNSGPIQAVEVDNKIKLVDSRQGYHKTLGHDSKSTLYDVIGYIDKDAEKWYSSWTHDGDKAHKEGRKAKAKIHNNIQNVDIYVDKNGKSLWDI
jgi:hypothetical protein